jgi:2-oxoglutarate ferredoxin oxidoreductase subunit alpha
MMVKQNSISIVLCGEAGQGLQTIETFLAKIFKTAGYHIFATKEYMSRIRGGINSTEIRVSNGPVAAPTERIDLLIPLSQAAFAHLENRISVKTNILCDMAKITPPEQSDVIDIPFSKIAAEIGNPVFVNTVACGVIAGLFGIDRDHLIGNVRQFFAAKTDDLISKNIKAGETGYEFGKELRDRGRVVYTLTPSSVVQDDIVVNGAEAVALGAMAGGCNFIASYPMSPGTGVLNYLARYSQDFPIVVEQAEDEISAVNMALGAWYAGARAIVTTSGGGFSLMAEGLSLAGMIESPVVIHLAQRPGPATGLPTRTEQADLELALYAGHGEFPRIILAPGNWTEAFYLTQKAFNLADRYQVPVIILTDQYLVDSYANLPPFRLETIAVHSEIAATAPDYQRYRLTENGVSPRGIPAYGRGLVAVDSDEHDESGRITEAPSLRTAMLRKRLQKLNTLKPDIIPPELVGPEEYRTLVVGWGSTYHVIRETLAELASRDWAFLHFKQVCPLPECTGEYLRKAGRIISVENNATGQLAKLLKLQTGITIRHQVLKYDGYPFSVEELLRRLAEFEAAKD